MVRPGEVVLLHPVFGGSDGMIEKHPVVIISNQEVIENDDAYYGLIITHNDNICMQYAYELKQHDVNGFTVSNSFVKTHLLSNVLPRMIIRKMGSVRTETLNLLRQMFVENALSD